MFKSDPTLPDGVISDPTVIKDGTTFVMYYGASKGDFSDPNTVRIFRATSTDGFDWRRPSQPVLEPGPPGSWDSAKAETPHVIRAPDGRYLMYYSGSAAADSEAGFSIGAASSRDGVTWQRLSQNPLLTPGSSGEFDGLSVFEPSVLARAGGYWMWYPGLSNPGLVAFGLAKSADGVAWTKNRQVLTIDVERRGRNETGVQEDDVLWNGAGYEMFYATLLDAGKIVGPIRHAVSADGMNWTKDVAPILDFGREAWTAQGLSAPSALLDGNTYRLWYVGTRTDFKSYYDGGFGLAEKQKE